MSIYEAHIMFKSISTSILLLISIKSIAAPGDFSPYSKISYLFIEGSDDAPVATLKFATNIPDSFKKDNCPSQYITIDISTDKGKAMYALALAARMADKEIRVTLPFCSASGTRPLVNAINL